MTRVDFYLLDTAQMHHGDTYACRLAEKAYRMHHSIYLNASNAGHAEKLDQLLWTFRQGSFLPHSLVNADRHSDPIVIGDTEGPSLPRDVLINLAAEVRTDFADFPRIAEIVLDDPEHKRAARARFRLYRQHGLDPQSHHVSG